MRRSQIQARCELPTCATTVLVVSHVRLYREGIEASLSRWPTLTVAATAANREEALRSVDALQPSIVVLDIAMKEALETVRMLGRQAPNSRIIAFGVEEVESEILRFAEAGVAGYVPCEASMEELVATIQHVARGELQCPPRITASVFQRLAELAGSRPAVLSDATLTSRERQVLTLIQDGLSNKEIAQTLHIELTTVKNHVHHVLAKLHVTSRNQAATQFTGALVGHVRTRSSIHA